MTPSEDDFRENIYNWRLQIEEDIALLSDPAGKWQPEDDRETRLAFAHKRRKLIELLFEAIESGDTWIALDNAIMLGVYSGLTHAFPHTYHKMRKLRLSGPAIRLGEINIQATRNGGFATRKLPDTEELLKELASVERDKPGQKQSWYQDEVGRRYKVTGRAVRKALKPKVTE